MVGSLFGLFAVVTVWFFVVYVLSLYTLTLMQVIAVYWITTTFSVWLADHVRS